MAPPAPRLSLDAAPEPVYDFPTAVGLMSGVRAPLELALVWCGWKVATYELDGTPFNPPRDLMDPEVRRQAEEDIELADLLTFQMDCSTLTRAKEIPMRGPARHIKALPMRSSGQYLRGLPRLEEPGAEAEKKRVEDANSLLDWGTGQMHRQLDKGDAALLENPKNSYAWEFGEVDRLLERGCVDYDHDACAHGGARAKKQKWRGNVPQITERRGIVITFTRLMNGSLSGWGLGMSSLPPRKSRSTPRITSFTLPCRFPSGWS